MLNLIDTFGTAVRRLNRREQIAICSRLVLFLEEEQASTERALEMDRSMKRRALIHMQQQQQQQQHYYIENRELQHHSSPSELSSSTQPHEATTMLQSSPPSSVAGVGEREFEGADRPSFDLANYQPYPPAGGHLMAQNQQAGALASNAGQPYGTDDRYQQQQQQLQQPHPSVHGPKSPKSIAVSSSETLKDLGQEAGKLAEAVMNADGMRAKPDITQANMGHVAPPQEGGAMMSFRGIGVSASGVKF
jgi:hypothetical protein